MKSLLKYLSLAILIVTSIQVTNQKSEFTTPTVERAHDRRDSEAVNHKSTLANPGQSGKPPQRKVSGAQQSLDYWFNQRAYPGGQINMATYTQAHRAHQQYRATLKTDGANDWESIGPHNYGGRTLCLAFNPQNPVTLYAGSASGGLWRSFTGGVGANAWHYLPTGFPVLGVGAVVIHPNDSNTVYIGTGEVYNYEKVGNGIAWRTSRGSYGIGILKSTDGGATWAKSLDWTADQMKGVQHMLINPQNPSAIWAATSDGTYYSADAGANWKLIHNVIMANHLLMDPNDTSVVYVSCGNFGSPGGGVYKTVNGGGSFTQLTGGLPASFTGKIVFGNSSGNPITVYASVADSLAGIGLYKTTDGGTNWTLINNNDFQMWQGWFSHDVVVNPNDPNHVMTVGIDCWKSTDGGANFFQKSWWQNWLIGSATPIGGPEGPPDYVHGDMHRAYFHPTNSDILYIATDGGVFRSTDGGESFSGANGMYATTQFYPDFSNSYQDSLFAMGGLQDNATVLYEGSGAWRRVIGGDGGSTVIHPQNDDWIFASYQVLNILFSNDKGFNWFSINGLPQGNTTNTNFIGPYSLCESTPDIMYGGRTSVYKTTDGGSTWNGGPKLDVNNPVQKLSIFPSDCDIVYAVTSPRFNPPAKVYRTTNGGTSWQNIWQSNLPDRYFTDIAVDPANAETAYIAVSGFGTDHCFKTTDGGSTWLSKSNGLPDAPATSIVIDPVNSNYLYIGNDLGVYASTDGGDSWIAFSVELPDAVIANDLSISNTNRKLRLATHGNGCWQTNLLEPVVATTPAVPGLSVDIFPNPVADDLNVQLYGGVSGAEYVLNVFNLQGKRMLRAKLSSDGTGRFDLRQFEAGIYVYRLEDGQQEIQSGKIVVR